MSWSSQMSNEPRAFSAALYSFQLVVRYFDLAGTFIAAVYPSLDSGAAGGHLCNRASLNYTNCNANACSFSGTDSSCRNWLRTKVDIIFCVHVEYGSSHGTCLFRATAFGRQQTSMFAS